MINIKFRIKEEKYESGRIKFYPQVLDIDLWKTLSFPILGLNPNGFDWCESYDAAKLVIDSFKLFELYRLDKVCEEHVHEID